MSQHYNSNYFSSSIFDYDYAVIADTIFERYKPKAVIEVGCGNGLVCKALADKGVEVNALDGYSEPDFSKYTNIHFSKVDLNDPGALKRTLSAQEKKFDVAICTEVAEHLNPDVSEALIDGLTSVAHVVIFSAAVPEQTGEAHINCRDRLFWNDLFEARSFYLRDTIRANIRQSPRVGPWYQLNIVDYVKSDSALGLSEYKQLVRNLISSESAASSFFYKQYHISELYRNILNLDIVKFSFELRNGLKRLLNKSVLKRPE